MGGRKRQREGRMEDRREELRVGGREGGLGRQTE